jgi:hypothetical protein
MALCENAENFLIRFEDAQFFKGVLPEWRREVVILNEGRPNGVRIFGRRWRGLFQVAIGVRRPGALSTVL